MLESTAMESAERRTAPRPGAFRRAVAGAWHVPAGLTFLARTPAVRLPALFCGAVTGMFLTAGAGSGLYLLQYVENVVIPAPGAVGETLGVMVPFLLGVGLVGAGGYVGLTLALLACAPLLQKVALEAQRAVRPAEPAPGDLGQALRASALLAVTSPLVLLLAMLPLVGPVLAALLASYGLAAQQTEVGLARAYPTLRERLAWHRRYLPEVLGFGFSGVMLVIVPCAGFLVAASLAAGAAFLVLEFEEGRSVPDSPEAPGPAEGA
jgi:hypothetical protein